MKTIAEQLRSCIHCGLCLDACPTYRLLGDEAESPRGRLQLMQTVLEPRAATTLAPIDVDRGALDHCLGCRHCEAVCPSGVPYGALLERTRATLPPPAGNRAWVSPFVRHVLIHPWRFALLARVGYSLRAFSGLMPKRLRELLPDRPPAWPRRTMGASDGADADLPVVHVLAGCAQQILQPEVADAVRRLIQACGHLPRLLPRVECCGALEAHLGAHESAERRRSEVAAFAAGGATVLVPSAGCSAHLSQVAGVVDGVVWLHRHADRLRFRADRRRVLYHPPCHHTHAQGIRREALELLARVPGLEVVQAEEPERCCGSAGSYQLLEPELAGRIRDEKTDRIRARRPELVLSSNPGCELFLREGLRQGVVPLPVENVLVYLADRLDGLEGIHS